MSRPRIEGRPWLDVVAPVAAGAVGGVVGAAGAPLPLAAAVAAIAWLVRVSYLLLRAPRRDRPAPWRLVPELAQLVDQSIDAADAYRAFAKNLDPGPLQDRLVDELSLVDDSVIAVWQATLSSVELARLVASVRPDDRPSLQAQLERLQVRAATLTRDLTAVVADTSAIAFSATEADGTAALAERIAVLREAQHEVAALIRPVS